VAAVPEAARIRRELGMVARAAEVAWPRARVALDVKVILTPPCVFH
jgi:hypothetical protein